jgi:hypothetical protein
MPAFNMGTVNESLARSLACSADICRHVLMGPALRHMLDPHHVVGIDEFSKCVDVCCTVYGVRPAELQSHIPMKVKRLSIRRRQ